MEKITKICLIVTGILLITFVITFLVVFGKWDSKKHDDKNVTEPVRLFLYTSIDDTGTELSLSDVKAISKTSFIGYASTVFLIHGYQSGVGALKLVKNAYLRNGVYNVIGVCWKEYAGNVLYKDVHGRIKVVAEQLMNFIKQVVEEPSVPLTFHNLTLVGHSLGAHIAGLIGKHIKLCAENGKVAKIPIIIGLDPAGPRFSIKDPFDRLDKTDADYVEVIHTSIRSIHGFYYYLKLLTSFLCPAYNLKPLGMEESIGTADFYPNYGTRQTGCSNPLIHITGACEHSKAVELFAESLDKTKNYEASQCNGTYKNQVKQEKCSKIGESFKWEGDPVTRKNLKGIYYFETPDDSLGLKILYALVVFVFYFCLTILLVWLFNCSCYIGFKCCRHANYTRKLQNDTFDIKNIMCSRYCNPCYKKQRKMMHHVLDVQENEEVPNPTNLAIDDTNLKNQNQSNAGGDDPNESAKLNN